MTDFDTIERRLRGHGPAASEDLPDVSAAAAQAGLLDVAYATMDTSVGRLLLASTPDRAGADRLRRRGQEDERLAELARRVSPRVLAAPRKLDRARRELDEYLGGRRRAFELELDQQLMTDFARRILTATAAIPYGSASTYGAVAAQAGSPRGSGRPATRWGPTRCRSSFPATASCTPAAASAGIRAGWTASGPCWRSSRARRPLTV